jgi:hypothetical protein
MNCKEIEINGIKYVQKEEQAVKRDGMDYCIVRTYSAGVFAGYVEKKDGQEVIVRNARRLWYWDGAASLSQLAMEGVKKPQNCKFPIAVDKVELTQAVEILYCTEAARKNIEAVPIWKQ